MNKRVETMSFAGLFAVLLGALGCVGQEPPTDPAGPEPEDPPVGSSENALEMAEPSLDQVSNVAHLSRISQAVLDVTRGLPQREPSGDEPAECDIRQIGCVTFEPCPEGAMGALHFAEGGCAIPGTDLVLEGSIILVEFSAEPAVVEVAFEGLTLRGNPLTGGFRLEEGGGWSFEMSEDLSGDEISGSGSVTRDGNRTTANVTITVTNENGTYSLVVSDLTIVDGAEMPDGGSVAVVLDPPMGIPEEALPEDLNGDGQVTWAERVQRELLLALEVSELGLVFLPTSPADGRVEGYLNDPTNELLIFCIDTNTQQITWGHCA